MNEYWITPYYRPAEKTVILSGEVLYDGFHHTQRMAPIESQNLSTAGYTLGQRIKDGDMYHLVTPESHRILLGLVLISDRESLIELNEFTIQGRQSLGSRL